MIRRETKTGANRRYARGLLCAALITVTVALRAVAEPVALEVEGLEPEHEAAVRQTLRLGEPGRDVSRAEIEYWLEGVEADVRLALEPFGYYEPRVEQTVEPVAGEWRVRLRVSSGEPVIVREIAARVHGPAGELEPVREALAAIEPKRGEPLSHERYERSKRRIQEALRSAGFFAARALQTRVEVVSEARSAHIFLEWDGGPRYELGEARFLGAPLSERFLQGFVPWEPGDGYSARALLQLQERLAETEYFESVLVQPLLDSATDRRVPIEVRVVANEQTVYDAGLFVSTDLGPGGRVGLARRWANRRGHRWNAEIEYAVNLKSATFAYGIPTGGLERPDYRIGTSFQDQRTDTSEARTARIAVAQVVHRWHGFARSLGLQAIRGDFEVANVPGSSSVLYADATLSRKRADDLLFARDGYGVSVSVRGGPEHALSSTSFAQISARGRWIRALGANHRVLLRGELGAMTVSDFDELPPELRFFAGGDRSIRGFDYEEIGETRADGGVIGGEYLATVGAEYEHYPLERWGAAVFVDAGDAFRTGFDLNAGAGVGIRWKSPVGLVRLDLAWPIAGEANDRWRVHLVIGPDL